jgi:two-component system, OmpR family, copper resistance phosphate regulon response regulator CusR
MRILIAEDDSALAGFVRKGLEAEHYAVDVSSDGEQARALATEFDYDLVVLDLNLPRLDGVAILRHLRTRKPSLPILVLTARGRVEDRVLCLDAGADDYLVKPFSFSELSARIRALLRRNRLPSESVLIVEDLKLDRVERRVTRGTRMIELTSKEFALLEYLMRNAGRRVTRAMIIEHVWNLSFDSATNLVDVYVAYLPNAPEDTPFFLYIALCLRVDYIVLSAVEQMLDCRAVPCLVSDRVMNGLLEQAQNSRRVTEQVFDRISDSAEMARITGSYAARVGAEEVRIARCGPYIWVRLNTGHQATDLLFTQGSHARSVPLPSQVTGERSAPHGVRNLPPQQIEFASSAVATSGAFPATVRLDRPFS